MVSQVYVSISIFIVNWILCAWNEFVFLWQGKWRKICKIYVKGLVGAAMWVPVNVISQ